MTTDFTTILKEAPAGQWIALSHTQDRIVATAINLTDALQAAHEMGEEHPVMMKTSPVSALVL